MSNQLYLVSWTGGYGPPQYTVKPTLELAKALAKLWALDADEADWIDVLRIDVDHMTVVREPHE